MEMALKAWFVFDHDDPKIVKSHDLSRLFDKLKTESQETLDGEFKKSISRTIPMAFISTTAFVICCISTKMRSPTGATSMSQNRRCLIEARLKRR